MMGAFVGSPETINAVLELVKLTTDPEACALRLQQLVLQADAANKAIDDVNAKMTAADNQTADAVKLLESVQEMEEKSKITCALNEQQTLNAKTAAQANCDLTVTALAEAQQSASDSASAQVLLQTKLDDVANRLVDLASAQDNVNSANIAAQALKQEYETKLAALKELVN